MNRALAASLALATVAALTACDDKSNGPQSPGSTVTSATTSTVATTPSTTPSSRPVGPPTISPVAAKGLSVTSADAFVRYYMAVLDYAAATGNVTLVRQWSDKGCAACDALASAYASTYANGGSVSGDFRTKIERVEQVRLVRADTAAVDIRVRHGRHIWLKKAGDKPLTLAGGPLHFHITLAAASGHWITYEMVTRK